MKKRKKISVITDIILLVLAVCAFIMAVLLAYEYGSHGRGYSYYYEYESVDGEKGVAVSCYGATKVIPQANCLLEDGTKVYGVKSFKKIERTEK